MLLQIRHLIEYVVFRAGWFLLKLIPAEKAYDFGLWLGRIGARVLPGRKSIAVGNILSAGITQDLAEAERIAIHSIGHFIGHILETIRAGDRIADNWRNHVTIDMPEETWRMMSGCEEPMMIVTGHLGVWEIAVPVISTFRPMIAIAQVMRNPYVNRFMSETHFRGRITVIEKSNGVTPDVMRKWDRERSALTIVMDQRPGGHSGIKLPFFGRETLMFTSPARFHLRNGHPMIFGFFVREGLFRYRMCAGEIIRHRATGDKETDIRELTRQLTGALEQAIIRYPEQYLWMHNRWKG